MLIRRTGGPWALIGPSDFLRVRGLIENKSVSRAFTPFFEIT
jgi:hypothetical protein